MTVVARRRARHRLHRMLLVRCAPVIARRGASMVVLLAVVVGLVATGLGIVAGAAVLLIGSVVLIGLAVNRRRPDVTAVQKEATPVVMVSSWVSSYEIVGRAATLGVLLFAFLLVQASQGVGRAREAANLEANIVDDMFELGDYMPPSEQEALQGDAVCYARAVARVEWAEMQETGELSRAPSAWTGIKGMRGVLASLAKSDSPLFSPLLSLDQRRGDARRQRVTESQPTIPLTVFWLLVLAVAVSLGWIAFQLPRIANPGVFILALGALSLFLTGALLVLNDISKPFGGVAGVKQTEIQRTEEDISEDFAESYGAERLPCDDDGLPRPAGKQGTTGATGPQGPRGGGGPRGRDARVTCKVAGDVGIECKVRFVGRAGRARHARIRVSLAGRTYARTVVRRTRGVRTTRLRSVRDLSPGTYVVGILTAYGRGSSSHTQATLHVR